MIRLLDVNVLIALLDARHVAHEAAHRWFSGQRRHGWATCPLTQNGFIRIVSGPRYGFRSGSPTQAVEVLKDLIQAADHVFWPDDLSLAESPLIDPTALRTSGQITDSYLLALAVSRGGELATFDRRLSTAAVRGGAAALHMIPA